MMIPPQKVVSRPASRGSLAREAGTIEQAGRSTANLHAEREASLLQAADTDATVSCLTAVAPMRATQSENDAQSSTKSASATPLSETGQLAPEAGTIIYE
jgi:hypothetical protein